MAGQLLLLWPLLFHSGLSSSLLRLYPTYGTLGPVSPSLGFFFGLIGLAFGDIFYYRPGLSRRCCVLESHTMVYANCRHIPESEWLELTSSPGIYEWMSIDDSTGV